MESLNAWSHLSDDVLSMTHALTCLHSLFCKLTVFGLLAENLILDLLGLIGKVGIYRKKSLDKVESSEAQRLFCCWGDFTWRNGWHSAAPRPLEFEMVAKIYHFKVEFTYGGSNHLQFFLWQFWCNLHLSTVFWGLLGWVKYTGLPGSYSQDLGVE